MSPNKENAQIIDMEIKMCENERRVLITETVLCTTLMSCLMNMPVFRFQNALSELSVTQLHSTLYVLPATPFNLCSTIYHLHVLS